MTKKITIPYFPRGIRFSTPLTFVIGIYLAATNFVFWGVLLLLLSVVILTTNYVTEINIEEKIYKDYLSFLGLRLQSESKRFKNVDRIVISKGNYSQKINTRVQSRQLDWSDYTATLLLDDDSLDLLTRNDKKELIRGLKEFADFLKVRVEDRTTNEYFWVDMTKY